MAISANPTQKIRSQTLRATGLVREPNPHSDQPIGSMDVADNVVLRRPGTAELRPGFKNLDSDRAEFAGFGQVDGVFAFASDLIVQGNGDTLATYIDDVTFDAACPPNAVRGVDVGNAFYFCGTDGVRKLYEDVANTVRAGAPVPYLQVVGAAASGTDGAVLDDNSVVAYRGILQIVYPDERVVTSAFSARTLVYNDSGTDTVSPLIHMYLPAELDVSGDPTRTVFASVYRSKNAPLSPPYLPPDELFLAYAKHQVTTTDVTNGYIVFSAADAYQDDRLGTEALYTNPSRETFKRSNVRPPTAHDLQIYAGSMWAARLTYPYKAQVRWLLAGGTTDLSGSATGIGSRKDLSVGVIQDSADLTGVTTTGLQVGMMVSVVGHTTAHPGRPLTITAINGTTVTLSEAITSASDPTAVAYFYDALHVSINSAAEVFPIHSADAFMRAVYLGEDGGLGNIMLDSSGLPYCTRSSTLRAYAVGDVARFVQQTAQSHLVNCYVEALDCAGQLIRVAATHGDEMIPPLALPDDLDWTDGERPATEHAITYSKDHEYEHFLEGVYEEIGVAGIPVLRIFAMTDCLWVLKARGDGIYRLTGRGERLGWTVTQFSKTCALLHPYLACSDGQSVYAWTNEGAVRIDGRGVVNLSGGVVGFDYSQLEREMFHGRESSMAFCFANRKDHEIVWAMPHDEESDQDLVVWNTQNEAWSRWFPAGTPWATGCYSDILVGDGNQYGLMYLLDGDGLARQERERDIRFTANVVERADREFAINVATASGTAATIDAGSGWTPVAGDIVVDGTERYMVVAAPSATSLTLDRSGLTTGAATAYEAFSASVRWAPEFGGGPGMTKKFEALTLHAESSIGTYQVQVQPQTPPAAETSKTIVLSGDYEDRLDDTDHEYPEDVRVLMTSDAALGNRFRAKVTIRQADSRIRLSGLTVEYADVARGGTSQ